VKLEKLSANRVRYTFDISVQEFEHGLDHAFEHVQKEVELKGFRKGHVPRNIYETKFGVESLYEDALNHVLHHKYHEAQNHPDYEIVGQPEVDVDISKIKRGEVFEISFNAPVKPEVTLGKYIGIEIKNVKADVTDSEVNAEIKSLLSQNGSLEPKEGTVELGDTAIFDFDGYADGVPFEGGKAENYQLEIGSNQFIPGFEEQMIGMAINEAKEINLTFPENYQAEHLAGKPVVFKILLHEVKAKITSELNDEWVQSLSKENVTTVEELKVVTRKELEDKKKQEAENVMTDQAINQVVDGASLDVPKEMIDEEITHYKESVEQQAKQYGIEFDMFLSLSGVTPEQFEAQAIADSTKRVRTSLVLEAVAKAEGMKATEEELSSKYEELATRYNMPVEEIKKYLPEAILANDVTINKAYKFVVDSAVKL